MFPTFPRLLAPAALVILLGATVARAGFVDWSYNWSNVPAGVSPTGGTETGALFLTTPPGGSGASPVNPIGVQATTSLQNGDDLYSHAGYSLKFTITDNTTGQPHNLELVTGEFNGEVTSSLASLTNTFTNGSGVQGFDFLGHHYGVTLGFTGADAPPSTWSGAITASVEVTDINDGTPNAGPPRANTPEPASLLLAGLALPAVGLAAGRRWVRKITGC